MEKPLVRYFLIPFSVFILCLLLYGKTKNHEFVWDDERIHLTGNPHLMQGDVSFFWENPYEGLYAPVPYSIWCLMLKSQEDSKNNLSAPLQPNAFHWLNILLFAACSSLVFYLFVLFGFKLFPAFAGALLFAVHPLQVESVAWISEARGLLASLFMFTSLAFYILYRKGKSKYLIVSFFAFGLSILSKPSVVIFPLVIFLVEWIFFNSRELKKYFPALAFLVIALPFIFLMPGLQQIESETWPLWKRFFLMFYSIDFYFLKSLLPFDLSASYGLTLNTISSIQLFLSPLPIIISGCLFFYFRKKTKGTVVLTFLLFIVFLLPVSGIVPFYFQKFSTVADRYAFLSVFALSFAAVFFVQKFNNTNFNIAFCILLSLLAYKSYTYADVWKNELSLWKYTDENYPRQVHVNNNLGITYHDEKQYEEAIEKYNIALSIDSSAAKVYTNRGNSYSFLKNFQKALQDYNKSISLDDNYGAAFYNRSVTYFVLNRNYEAWDDLQKAKALGYFVNPVFENDLKKALNR